MRQEVLLDEIADRTGFSPEMTRKFYQAVTDLFADSLDQGKLPECLPEWGSFIPKLRDNPDENDILKKEGNKGSGNYPGEQKNEKRVERINLPATAPFLMIYVEQYEDGIPEGKMVNLFVKETIHFRGFGDMLVKMDQVYDYLDFPQAAHEPRSFMEHAPQDYDYLAPYKKRFFTAVPLMGRPRENEKAMQTFFVRTQFRHNGSWQGSIVWLEKKREQNFISALQCLKLMMEALQDSEASDKQ